MTSRQLPEWEGAAALEITSHAARLRVLYEFTFLTVVCPNPYQRGLLPAYPPPKKRLTQPGSPPPSVARL